MARRQGDRRALLRLAQESFAERVGLEVEDGTDAFEREQGRGIAGEDPLSGA